MQPELIRRVMGWSVMQAGPQPRLRSSAEPQGSPEQLGMAAPLSDPSLGLPFWLLPCEAGP